MTHGESHGTRHKEEFIGMCLGYDMRQFEETSRNNIVKRPYFVFDLNAGSGFNARDNVVGTPQLIMRQIEKRNIKTEIYLVEKSRDTCDQLKTCLIQRFPKLFSQGALFHTDQHHLHVKCSDNFDVLSAIPTLVAMEDRAEYARGAVISDPNGWSPSRGGLELAHAEAILRSVPRFLFLVHFPFGLAKKVRGYAAHNPEKNVSTRTAADYLKLRPYWLLTEPWGTPTSHICLCGSWKKLPGHDGARIYQSDSPKGQEILHYVDHIAGEDANAL